VLPFPSSNTSTVPTTIKPIANVHVSTPARLGLEFLADSMLWATNFHFLGHFRGITSINWYVTLF